MRRPMLRMEVRGIVRSVGEGDVFNAYTRTSLGTNMSVL